MEELAKVDTIAFDKTGTLTHGRPQVTAVTSVGSMTDDDLYHLVASIEQKSEHPLGKAIVSDYTSHHEAPLTAVEDVTIVPGKGLEATMNGESSTRVLAGNAAMMNVSGVTIPDSVKADVGIAMVGTLSPVWGALVHNGGSLLVVLNSALLLSWKYKTNSDEDRNPYVGKLVSNQ